MKQIVNLLKEQSRALFFIYSLVLLSFFLPNRINSIVLLVLGFFSVIPTLKNRANLINKGNILSFLLFLVLCIGTLYSENKKEAYAIMERSLSLLLIPLLISSFNWLSSKQKQLLLSGFIISAFLAAVYCLFYTSYAFFETGTAYPTGQTGHFTYNRFMHHRLSSPLGIHAIYFSFYCSFAAIATLQKLLYTKHQKFIVLSWNAFLFLFFVFFLYLLKSSLFAFVFPASCVLLVFLKFRRRLLQLKYSIAFLVVLSITGLFSYHGIRSKLDNFETSFHFEDQSMRPLAMRMAMWTSAWNVVQKQPFLGVGTGDGQEELMKEYQRVHFVIAKEHNFNAHNMYLQFWISNGILMVMLFIMFLLLLLMKAIKHRNYLFFVLIFYFSFFSITESTMLKQKGMVFFVFFAFLFITDPNCWRLPTNENNTST